MLTTLSNWASLCTDISDKLCKSSQKRLDSAKLGFLPNLLPQPANIFARICPSYPWYFASHHRKTSFKQFHHHIKSSSSSSRHTWRTEARSSCEVSWPPGTSSLPYFHSWAQPGFYQGHIMVVSWNIFLAVFSPNLFPHSHHIREALNTLFGGISYEILRLASFEN